LLKLPEHFYLAPDGDTFPHSAAAEAQDLKTTKSFIISIFQSISFVVSKIQWRKTKNSSDLLMDDSLVIIKRLMRAYGLR